jgi:hypothetical protein
VETYPDSLEPSWGGIACILAIHHERKAIAALGSRPVHPAKPFNGNWELWTIDLGTADWVVAATKAIAQVLSMFLEFLASITVVRYVELV